MSCSLAKSEVKNSCRPYALQLNYLKCEEIRQKSLSQSTGVLKSLDSKLKTKSIGSERMKQRFIASAKCFSSALLSRYHRNLVVTS